MKPDKATIIRTVLLVVALVNAVLEMFGVNTIPIEDEQISQAVSVIILIAGVVSAWWKNNSFTKEAVIADEYLKELKATPHKEQ